MTGAAIRQERVADLVRREFPHRTVYFLIALNLALLVLLAVGWYSFDKWQRKQDSEAFDRQQVQDQWNTSLKGQLEGLKATVEFGPRLDALEAAQTKQTQTLDAIAEKLGIEETP